VDYGAAHAARYGCRRFGPVIDKPLHPLWSATSPVHLIGHSFGGQTARVLLELLSERAFEGWGDTSAEWVLSVVAISSPLCGALATYTLGADASVLSRWDKEQNGAASHPERGLAPVTSAEIKPDSAPATGSNGPAGRAGTSAAFGARESDGWGDSALPFVRWLSCGHIAGMGVHAAEWLDWAWLRAAGMDFQMQHLGLGWHDAGVLGGVGEMVESSMPWGRSRLYRTTNCAPFDLTIHGAARLNRRARQHKGVMFASVVGMGSGWGRGTEADAQEAGAAGSAWGAVAAALPWGWREADKPGAVHAASLDVGRSGGLGGSAAADSGDSSESSETADDADSCRSVGSSSSPAASVAPAHAAGDGPGSTAEAPVAGSRRSRGGPCLPSPRAAASAVATAKSAALALLRAATHAVKWDAELFEEAVPGFDAARWLRGGHDGLASEVTQTCPLVYSTVPGRPPAPAPTIDGLPGPGCPVESGVWYVHRVAADHLGIIPSPTDEAVARDALERILGALAARELAV